MMFVALKLSLAKYGKGVFKEDQPQDYIFSSEQETGPLVDMTEAQAAVPIAAHVFLPVFDMINGLRSGQIGEVSGEVRYVECKKDYIMTFSFQEKYQDILPFLDRNREEVGPEMLGTRMLSNRKWTDCKRQWTIPIVSKEVDYEGVNWLFLFLGKQLHNTSVKQMRDLI
ncbi:hypothetical protein SLEP1_g52792 [Rubroshorea leprosula]|uniref:DUF7086 domain-containing protein n=1 Tax=Rubroshorea leprosula TaxID=152421 RepID=A0AAV5M7D3_9ROSI|nr:hypothetical protein SLEP1_g52792 [Rubroshorea leprosula]